MMKKIAVEVDNRVYLVNVQVREDGSYAIPEGSFASLKIKEEIISINKKKLVKGKNYARSND